ncbi:MAG: aminotransferase class IV [Lewinellaceae bacterium]|nr:aminotransferase class IV [Phaeodactylibacter sp.]MCB0611846.1 aminotransferase class IV [Phaeodactylibacter sp.]MCB9349150.1 aminotransferase class IV [Lewinellaceae bacterium]
MNQLLLETIRCEDGSLQNLEWHQQRVERSCHILFGAGKEINFQKIHIPPEANTGLFKCRILYGRRIHEVMFAPYSIRPVKKLKLVQADGLEYSHKYARRTRIDALFAQRGQADDILMVINGLIADTSYANVAVFDGSDWLTPATPLLAGTRRASLLAAKKMIPADIPPHQLANFEEIRLINAMMGLEEGPRLHPDDVIPSFPK